jgi:hypothetical protein
MNLYRETQKAITELKALYVISYESYGLSSPAAVRNTISSLREFDKNHPIEKDISRIREIELARRKG